MPTLNEILLEYSLDIPEWVYIASWDIIKMVGVVGALIILDLKVGF